MSGITVAAYGERLRRRFGLLAALLCTFGASSAVAQDDGLFGIETHGFVSQGFIYTTDNEYLAKSSKGSFEFTEIGVNFTRPLSENLRLGAQVLARDLGPDGNYKPSFDWYYLDYRAFDWLGIRVGRTKIPFGLYNETSDVDAARAPILLPQAAYSLQNRDYLLAHTGIDIYGYVPFGGAGALEYRLYGGTIFYEPPDPQPNVEYSIPYIAGARAQWFTPLDGLSAAFSALTVRIDQDLSLDDATAEFLQNQDPPLLSEDFGGVVKLGLPIWVLMGSIEYQAHDLLLAAEYSYSGIDLDTNEPLLNALLFPDGSPYPANSAAFYGMAAYRVTPALMPGAYFASTRPNLDKSGRRDYYRNDLAVFIRYDLTPNWLVKLEGHYLSGTAGLNPKLNNLENEEGLQTLTKEWGAVLVKTTAYF